MAGRRAYGKTSASVREVPLSGRAFAALESSPARLDTRLVFPAPEEATSTSHFRSANGNRRSRPPAFLTSRIYDLRSTFASQALAAEVSVFELARIMGTSVRMIERHYGALLQGSGEAIRGKLDAYLDRLGQESATAQEGE